MPCPCSKHVSAAGPQSIDELCTTSGANHVRFLFFFFFFFFFFVVVVLTSSPRRCLAIDVVTGG